MFSKRRLTAACLLVLMTAFVAWAASWQIQTKLATAGGTLQVEGKAVQSGAGSLMYNTMADTLADADVTVTANAGYEIASITKNGVAVPGVVGLPTFTTNFTKAATAQGLIVSFKGKQITVTGAAVGPGKVTPASATGAVGSSVKFTATPSTAATAITAITVNGADYTGIALPATGTKSFTLSNVTVATDVVVTFATATAVAPAPMTIVYNSAKKLKGVVSGPGVTTWTQVSGPVAVDTAAWTTATPYFTAPVVGDYEFKLAQMVGTTALASSTTKVTAVENVADAMRTSCNGCHNPINGMNPSNSFANWSSSSHNAKVSCVSCHTDGAMPSPVNMLSVDAVNLKNLNASAGTVGAYFCARCHSSAGHSIANATCNDCHNPHAVNAAPTTALGNLHIGAGTVAGGAAGNAQYLPKGGVCADCHGTSNSAILTEWAESAHAQAIPAEGLSENAWNAGEGSNASCARCHSTTGFISNPSNTGTTTPLLATDKQEVLGCKGCHTDVTTGELRIGDVAYTLPYKIMPAAVNGTIPAAGASSVCIPCHAGRASGAGITSNTFSSRFPSSHYLPAGGTLNNAIGYHFTGQTYDTFGKHKTAGAAGNGPCVTCHMSITAAGKGHSFEAVTKVDGVVTEIKTAAACSSCHADMTAEKLVADKASFVAAVNVLKAALETKESAFYNVADGKFYTDATFTTEKKAYTTKDALGAAYNLYVVEHAEPGIYVHNRGYGLKLIQDSLEFLNTGAVTGAYTVAEVDAAKPAPAFSHVNTISNTACASCHGATVPSDPSAATCVSCHTGSTPELVAKVEASKHAPEVSGHASANCGRCHTTEGYTSMVAAVAAGTANFATTASFAGTNNVSCAACHDSHNGAIRTTSNWDPKYEAGVSAATDQFKMCTSCHNLVNENAVPVASGLEVSGTTTAQMQQHYKDWYRNIASTHYDLPSTGTVTNVGTTIEGYNVRYNQASACTDCHGHELYTNTNGVSGAVPTAGTVQTEWAQSGHAGKILSVKFAAFTTAGNSARSRTQANAAAVMAAGVTAATGQAWEHYDWDDCTKRINPASTTDRQGCQKCHTATGAANYLNNPAAYNSANNDFSHLVGWNTNKVSAQNEVLYCWGCHNNAETGALRNPGAIPAEYKFNGANFSFPDSGASNVCFACHAGRVGGGDIVALTTAGNTFTNVGFKNSHYMAAAGLMYAKIGYTSFIDPNTAIGTSTYGKSLTTPEDGGALTSTHRKLGTAAIIGDHGITAEMGIAEGGPCATCHYANGNHDLEMGADAFTKVCVNCHTAEGAITLTAENFKEVFIEEQALPFKDAIALAVATLNNNYKIVYNPAKNPYFFEQDGTTAVTNWTRSATAGVTALSAAEAEKLMGACFNINVLNRDPAAYAHARTYARRLLYDSIDYLDDKTINMSTGNTAIAWDPIKYVKGASAAEATESFKYLAGYNRTTLVYNALERP